MRTPTNSQSSLSSGSQTPQSRKRKVIFWFFYWICSISKYMNQYRLELFQWEGIHIGCSFEVVYFFRRVRWWGPGKHQTIASEDFQAFWGQQESGRVDVARKQLDDYPVFRPDDVERYCETVSFLDSSRRIASRYYGIQYFHLAITYMNHLEH